MEEFELNVTSAPYGGTYRTSPSYISHPFSFRALRASGMLEANLVWCTLSLRIDILRIDCRMCRVFGR